MSASDHLSQELFFTAHRGLGTGKKHHIKKSLGMHWSADAEVAKKFSLGSTMWSGGRKHGVIVHANVPVSAVETNKAVLSEKKVIGDVGSDGGPEQEIPVKKGSTVLVTGITKRKGEKTRTRTYNPPREMKA